ncbi:MAG TPA: twin-arginine translocation signal domain-containing protein, partial [Pirellulales bacterium]
MSSTNDPRNALARENPGMSEKLPTSRRHFLSGAATGLAAVGLTQPATAADPRAKKAAAVRKPSGDIKVISSAN